MGALLTDLYQFSMTQAYLAEGMEGLATFELFVRRQPATRHFFVAAGLEQALDYLEALRFDEAELAWLERHGFSPRLIAYLRTFRFSGEVYAMPEGTVFFANEPILRVTAPLPQAQLVESRLLNIIHFQTLIASKGVRVVLAARGRRLVEFGMRRSHGAEAARLAARAAYLVGFEGTATTEAGLSFGIPVFGTMAHSYVQAHAHERDAFEAFAHAAPSYPTFLIDTYDTEQAVQAIVALADKLTQAGIQIGGVRIDSGDLDWHARTVRRLLDEGGLSSVAILASGDLDEWQVQRLVDAGAPIHTFGVGTALATSSDLPALDAVYKLQSYAGMPRRKKSEGKTTWPGVKQVCRRYDAEGVMLKDYVQLDNEPLLGQPLLQRCMTQGHRLAGVTGLAWARRRCSEQLATLPSSMRELAAAQKPYEVVFSEGLRSLARRMDGG